MLNMLSFMMILLFAGPVRAEELLFQSGKRQVALIELYSSEGCSSCPPADRWISGLRDHKKLWKEFVPINFHVDYWNRLGWVDRFSNQQFSRRQRVLAREWGSGRVYTPGFVKNGQEWRTQSLQQLLGAESGNLAVLKLGSKKIKINFNSSSQNEKTYKVHLALLGHGLKTEVKYGENAGETLEHEFVVLEHEEKTLVAQRGLHSAEMEIPSNLKSGAQSFSLAVWVTVPGSEKPVQATGGPLASL